MKHFFTCVCGDISHQFIIIAPELEGEDESEKELYLEVMLNPSLNFFQRLWVAIQYIFGKQSIYGIFEEIILDKAKALRLVSILNQYFSVSHDL